MNLSLLWKILLSTALIITVVLGATAWFVENQTVTVLTYDLQGAIRSGFESYEALWKERADSLRSIGTVLSAMSDVRAAFQTNDRATIRDTAGEIWSRISQSSAIFLVTDPQGKVIASLEGCRSKAPNCRPCAALPSVSPHRPRGSRSRTASCTNW